MRGVPSISHLLQDVLSDFLISVDGLTAQPVKIFGPKDDNANVAPPGVWWDIGEERWGNTQGVRLGGPGKPGVLYVREIPISFLVFGGDLEAGGEEPEADDEPASTDLQSTDVTELLMGKLINSCQRRLTQFGYKPLGAKWGQAIQSGIGLACDLSVAIRLPLLREDNGSVKMPPVNPAVEFSHE